jgi:ubiquinone/menaquinone biosynthesis C-methylase UbiE
MGINHRLKMNIWDSYKIGFQVIPLEGDKDNYSRHSIKKLIIRTIYFLLKRLSPIDYVRWRELPFIFDSIQKYTISPIRILDISSPKLLPLTMAKKLQNALIYAVDIVEAEIVFVKKAKKYLKLENIAATIEDARNLNYPDNYFDLVTAVSVFEHIAPEAGGEIPAARELNRVLAPGGLAIITVPFAKKYFAEYIKGSVYERTAGDDESIFFQRFYDERTLIKNIIEPSTLELVDLKFIEERFFLKDPRKRLTHYVCSSTYQMLIFGIFYPIISRIFLSKPKELQYCQKPYIACLVMRKVS